MHVVTMNAYCTRDVRTYSVPPITRRVFGIWRVMEALGQGLPALTCSSVENRPRNLDTWSALECCRGAFWDVCVHQDTLRSYRCCGGCIESVSLPRPRRAFHLMTQAILIHEKRCQSSNNTKLVVEVKVAPVSSEHIM